MNAAKAAGLWQHLRIVFSPLLEPSDSDTIYLTAPAKLGDYTFECTYPGALFGNERDFQSYTIARL